jgi:diaminopimelate epimerase
MEKIVFHKFSGAGNDFILIDKTENPLFELKVNSVRKLCDRHDGIGGDGVITISDSIEFDFMMNYYNSDGSTGSLCGNGARCAIKYASDSRELKGRQIIFLSNDVKYSGEFISENETKFFLNPPSKIKLDFKVKASRQLINAHFADTGSPHVVIKVNEILISPDNPFNYFNTFENFPVEQIGREIRYLPEFSPGGVNVNFIFIDEKNVHMRTFERGVESETLSCGTGSVAAGIICYLKEKLIPPIQIITKRNEKLFVNFNVQNQKFENVSLSGPVSHVFSGSIPLNFLE